jgi:hypothetical protein
LSIFERGRVCERERLCVPVKWQRERERRMRMTRHDQKVSTPALNSLNELQEVNYFAETVRKAANVYGTHLGCSISTQQYIPLVG